MAGGVFRRLRPPTAAVGLPETGPTMTIVPPGPARATRPRRILVVDDNADGRRALSRILTLKGFEVVDRPDGASALEAMRQVPPPDIVLTDLLLPDMDGRQVSWHAHQLVPSVRVALITGWSVELGPQDQQRWGFDEIFLKPLDTQELVQYLLDLDLGESGPDSVAGTPLDPKGQ